MTGPTMVTMHWQQLHLPVIAPCFHLYWWLPRVPMVVPLKMLSHLFSSCYTILLKMHSFDSSHHCDTIQNFWEQLGLCFPVSSPLIEENRQYFLGLLFFYFANINFFCQYCYFFCCHNQSAPGTSSNIFISLIFQRVLKLSILCFPDGGPNIHLC